MEKINGLTYTNQKETQEIKRILHTSQANICPILKVQVPIEKMVADHQHKKKAEDCTTWDDGGKGLIRGAISFDANALEGRFINYWTRLGMDKYGISPSAFLRNLADYLEEPPASKLDECYVYYSEKPKRKKVSISEYNRVKKYYLELHPRKKVIIKKPIYITDDWNDLVQLTNDHIQKLAEEKEERKRIKLENKNK